MKYLYKKMLWFVLSLGLFNFMTSVGRAAETVNSQDSEVGIADTVSFLHDANPPLSNFAYEPGLYRITVQPSYYSGSADLFLGETEFKGGALAFDYTKVVTERWGWYLTGLLFQYRANRDFTLFTTDLFLKNVKHNVYTIKPGLHYLLWKQEGYKPTLTVMGGPYFRLIDFSQTYVLNGTFLNTDFPNQTIYDFDMKSSPLIIGASVGVRLSWRIANSFAINAFGFLQVPLSDTCQPYKITALRTDLEGNSDQGLCQDETKVGVNFDGSEDIFGTEHLLSGGFNLEYIPWKLTVNISSLLIGYGLKGQSQVDTSLISISKSFGGSSASATNE